MGFSNCTNLRDRRKLGEISEHTRRWSAGRLGDQSLHRYLYPGPCAQPNSYPTHEQICIDNHKDFADYGDEDADDLPQPFWQLVKRLGELPRLKSVALRFHPECASDENFASTTELQTIAFRATVMQKLTASLASLPRPLSELAIHNLQNINPTDPETVANLTKVLTGLRSFRLNITNEMEGDREPDLQVRVFSHIS